MRLLGLVLIVALTGSAHADGVAQASVPQDSIDVTPGRVPDRVRAQLRKAIAGITDFAVRSDVDRPADADTRTRLHFELLASGKIRTSIKGSDMPEADPKFRAESLVLIPDLALAYVAKRAHFPPAPVDVEVDYEFRTPKWRAAQLAARKRMDRAVKKACAALSGPPGHLDRRISALAQWAALPFSPTDLAKIAVGKVLKSAAELKVINGGKVTRAQVTASVVGDLCALMRPHGFARDCPAFAKVAAAAHCARKPPLRARSVRN